MKKLLFKNVLFFPNLDPPPVIFFKDIVHLLIQNGARTFIGALLLFFLLSPAFLLFNRDRDDGMSTALFAICVTLVSVYFLVSVAHTIRKSWQWYSQYVSNYTRNAYKSKYKLACKKIYNAVKSEYLAAKLNQQPSEDFLENYIKREDEMFDNLKRNYVSRLIKKNSTLLPSKVDNELLRLEGEFDLMIERVRNPVF